MADPELAAKLKAISLAELDIKQALEDSPPEALTSHDLNNYQDTLKEVSDLLKEFRRQVNNVLIDPPEGFEETEKKRLKDVADTL